MVAVKVGVTAKLTPIAISAAKKGQMMKGRSVRSAGLSAARSPLSALIRALPEASSDSCIVQFLSTLIAAAPKPN